MQSERRSNVRSVAIRGERGSYNLAELVGVNVEECSYPG